MADMFSREKRTWIMSRIRSSDTQPERFIRRMLHGLGYRFRLQRNDLPGRPDIVLPKYRTVIFVHGCFWHGHDCSEGRRPLTNTQYWNAKIDRNVKRDALRVREYRRIGWKRIVVWTCELEHPDRIERRLGKLLPAERLK